MIEAEFNVLYQLMKTPKISQRILAEQYTYSLGKVNKTINNLLNKGYIEIDDTGVKQITEAGLKALEPYKVRNAIIMAAGLSSRCAPLSFEKPKALFVVKDEVLIERQIRQLKERNINQIYVVVGYMKELFYYLEEKFDVQIVPNYEYHVKNNLSSIYAVKENLGNSYICYSDNYIQDNGFEPYVYKSYFAAQYSVDYTDEYIIEFNKKNLITQYYISGKDAWYQMGEMYFDFETARKFMELLEHEYSYPAIYTMKIDDFYIRHLSEFEICIKKNKSNAVVEFDTLAEIEKFDDKFIRNMGENIVTNICGVLECNESEITEAHRITRGNTNVIFSFNCKNKKYIYRHPGKGTDKIINRYNEYEAIKKAEQLGLDNTLVYCDPIKGWKISEYVENIDFDYENRTDELRAIEIIRTLHSNKTKQKLGWDLNMLDGAQNYHDLISGDYFNAYSEFKEIKDIIEVLYKLTKLDGYEFEMCHNDCCDSNILLGKNSTYLIDWEYAADNDPAADIASYIIGTMRTSEDVERILKLYFGRELMWNEKCHFYAYIAITAYYYFSWAIYQESLGNDVGELLHIYYVHLKKYSKIALDAYEKKVEE